MIGEHVSGWVITGVLGHGSQGVVYEARHASEPRDAAIKVLPPAFSRDPSRVRRFFDEARAAAAIRHRGVIEVYGHGLDAKGRAYIAMERLRGESLFERVRRGPLSVGEAVAVLRQIAHALDAAHTGGAEPVVHRDLKPENVFLVPEGDGVRVVIVDFGIAKLSDEARSAGTLSGAGAYGTPAYMSPEQCRGESVDARADLYALGCVLHEMLSGTPPFGFTGTAELLRAHCDAPPPSLAEMAEEVPDPLDALARRLLAKRPDDRPASARQVLEALDAAGLASTGLTAPRPATLVSAPPDGLRARAWRSVLALSPWVAGGVACIAGSLMLGLSILLGVGNGYLASPNWAFTYAVLVPITVMLMLGFAQQSSAALRGRAASLGVAMITLLLVLVPLDIGTSVIELLRRKPMPGLWWYDAGVMGVVGATAQGIFSALILTFVIHAVAWAQLVRRSAPDPELLAEPIAQLAGAGALVQMILYLSNVQYLADVRGTSIVAAVLPWLEARAYPAVDAGHYQSAITLVTSAMVAGFLIVATVTLGRWPSRGIGRGSAIALLLSLVAATALPPLGPVVAAVVALAAFVRSLRSRASGVAPT